MNVNLRQFLCVIYAKYLRESGISKSPWGPLLSSFGNDTYSTPSIWKDVVCMRLATLENCKSGPSLLDIGGKGLRKILLPLNFGLAAALKA